MRLITGDECGLVKECIPELSTNAEEEEKNEAVAVPSRRRVLITKDKGVELLNPEFLMASTQNFGSNSGLRRKGIVNLTWMSTTNDSQFASLHVDGTVQLWKATSSSATEDMKAPLEFARYRRVSEISNIFQTTTTTATHVENNAETETANSSTMMMDPFSRPIGLYAFETTSCSGSSHNNTQQRLVACNAQGTVCILNPNNIKSSSCNDDDEHSSPIVKTFETVVGNQNMTSTPTTKNIARLQYPKITATALDSSLSSSPATPTRIALGGRDRDVMIWDLESSQQVYKAKNLPPDPQTLLQPLVWPTCMTFVQQTSAFDGNPHILAVGTAYCQVRIYDVRVHQAVMSMKTANKSQFAPMKQRPLAYSPINDCPHVPLEHRVTTLLPMANDSSHLVVGDAAGYLQTMDMRLLEKNTSHTSKSSIHGQQYGQAQPSCMVGRFVGPGGSVRGLAQDANGSTLAAVGLDRMLRLYDTSTRKHVYCMYLKQRLNCVLFGRQQAYKKKRYSNKSSHDNENDDEDDDDDSNNAGAGDEDDYDSADMDADDVVEDYVDSSDEEGKDGNGPKGRGGSSSNDKRISAQENNGDDNDDGSSSSEDDGEGSSDDSSDEDDNEKNEEAPRKKTRR
jgi:ribosome biogenesis protein NSA1